MTKKKEKKPVFDALFEAGVCFAVCVASSKFINREVAAFAKDYFIIINKCDEKHFKEHTFYPAEGYKRVCLRSLAEDEIRIFRKNKDKFVKIQSNEYGRVYELKEQSFKDSYDRIRLKLGCKLMRDSQQAIYQKSTNE